MLKFVVAPDSFKGTMSSMEICDLIEKCIYELAPESLVVKVPVADGIGELIIEAVSKGAVKIILGLGGSATNDGGIGMAQALGFRFLDSSGNSLLPVGANLINISGIVPPSSGILPESIEIVAACDVINKLYGLEGAAHIFAPQKGADPAMVKRLDAGLKHFAAILKTDIGVDVSDIAGSGAAGGLGAGVIAFTGGTLKPGVELLLDTLDFDRLIQNADYVFTGEGRMDSQSLSGKTPVGIARRASRCNIPVIGIAGSLGGDIEQFYQSGFTALFSTIKDIDTLENALLNCHKNLIDIVQSIVSLIICK